MASRLALQALLEGLLERPESVYFQPPPTVQMVYPAIVYRRDSANSQFADDIPYLHEKRYQITVIDRNPDSTIPEAVARLPKCLFSRHFTADNLNHDVYNIYF